MKDFFRINIALNPDKQVKKDASTLSKSLIKENAHYFVLDSFHYYPHVTLFAPVVNEEIFSNIIKKLGEAVKEHKKFVCKFTHFSYGQGFISIEMQMTEILAALQKRIAETLLPYQGGELPVEFRDAADYRMFR